MTEKVKNLEEKLEKEEGREFGFQLMVDKTGSVTVTPINIINDFELAGLLDYANQKKIEIMQLISHAPEVKTITALGQLTNLIGRIVQSAQKQTEVSQPEN